MNHQEAIQQHKEKWRIWNEQRQLQNALKNAAVEQGMENYAANLIRKMAQPQNRENHKAQELNKKIGTEIESNVCSICLELMIPPERQPIILFPCGHNLCKDCLFVLPPKGPLRKGLKLKLEKCSLCREHIQSYALNQSLMALICTYSNNKALLEQEQAQRAELEEEQRGDTGLQQLRIRCEVLEKEKHSLMTDSDRFGKQKAVLQEVVDALRKEKKKNQHQMEKLQEEARLIDKCLTEKLQQFQTLDNKLKEIHDKDRILEKALAPLRMQKEKRQLLEVARLISKQ